MFATIAKLTLTVAVLAVLAPDADAQSKQTKKRLSLQEICAKTKDPVKCNCVFRSGGRLYHRPGGSPGVGIESMANVDRYIACMRHNGRPNG